MTSVDVTENEKQLLPDGISNMFNKENQPGTEAKASFNSLKKYLKPNSRTFVSERLKLFNLLLLLLLQFPPPPPFLLYVLNLF